MQATCLPSITTLAIHRLPLSVLKVGIVEILHHSAPFWADAKITKEGKEIDKQRLKWDKNNDYPQPGPSSEFKFIGTANFILPKPEDKTPLTITVEGSFVAQFYGGAMTPIGLNAKAIHQLLIMELE